MQKKTVFTRVGFAAASSAEKPVLGHISNQIHIVGNFQWTVRTIVISSIHPIAQIQGEGS